MSRAGDEAAGGRAALAAKSTTDPATLERVREALLRQLSGTMPLVQREHPRTPGSAPMDRRTVTPLHHARGSR